MARTHLSALEQTPGAEVIAGIDTAPVTGLTFRGHPFPVYPTLRDAAGHRDPDVVVIATPTPAHAAGCTEAAACFPAARILVEKPAADNLSDARQMLSEAGGHQPADVAYHMAFSPEVIWGMQITQENALSLGAPAAAEASFADPYHDKFDQARLRLGNSWIDSGVNSLSVLSRFADLVSRSSLQRIGAENQSVYEAHVTCRAGIARLDTLILTSWHVTDAAKSTRIRFSSGAELVMDHTAVAGYLRQDGRVTAVYGSDRAIPRRERHYLALYEWWLTRGNSTMPAPASLHLHELLLEPTPDDPVPPEYSIV
ncbi:MAG: Gfo/Idh/MocA family oxidoreductase [Actinomycetota bacterium]|nr:Gfo/Idh/MocA family oxidoreductase [Actinomycetota bacterium]